jgi:hypothetical protein
MLSKNNLKFYSSSESESSSELSESESSSELSESEPSHKKESVSESVSLKLKKNPS